MSDPLSLNPRRIPCTRCGEPAEGSAHINGERYCHGDYTDPTCYMLASWERTAKPGRVYRLDEVLAHFGLTPSALPQDVTDADDQ